MITIDGSQGEGGGQIVRTALALAIVTGQDCRIDHIRRRRDKPGLQRQHLTAVRAAADVGQAEVEGDALGSTRLTFRPRGIQPGAYRFATGTAGSTTLVLQTVLPPLLHAGGPSSIVLEGGTHNPWAPPFEFLHATFLPLLNRMGPRLALRLERHGFYPAGGGRLHTTLEPAQLAPLVLVERGEVVGRSVRAFVSRLPLSIAQREVRTVCDRLQWDESCGSSEEVPSNGPGNAVVVQVACEHVTETFVGFGRRGVPAERVAEEVAVEADTYLRAGVPVGPHLADQLLLPLALAGGGRFVTLPPTPHTRTNAETIGRFLPIAVRFETLPDDRCEVVVERT